MFRADMQDVKELEKDLKTFARKALPFATKQTINRGAFKGRELSQENIERRMITRNKWTKGSVRVQMSKTLDIDRQESIVGSLEGYMATQEFGGVERGEHKHQPIATSYSAGQAEGKRPRTRAPRRPNKRSQIRLQRRGGAGMSRRQRNLVAVREAAEGGSKYIYMDLGKRQGIFKVLGGKRKPRVKMVWDLSRKAVTIPRTPWLAPIIPDVGRQLPEFYRDALLFQLRRHRVLGY